MAGETKVYPRANGSNRSRSSFAVFIDLDALGGNCGREHDDDQRCTYVSEDGRVASRRHASRPSGLGGAGGSGAGEACQDGSWSLRDQVVAEHVREAE